MRRVSVERNAASRLKPVTTIQILAFGILCSGCFSYIPTELGTLQEGRQVRVQMTRQGFAALPEVPNQSGPRLAGTLVSRDDNQLRLLVPVALDGQNKTLAQQLVIPASDVVRFERRELSRTRTAIAIAGGLATATALYLTFEKGKPFSRDPSEEPENEEGVRASSWRILVLRIPVR